MLFLSVLLRISLHAQVPGSLTYQNTLGVGKERYVFGVDPLHPTQALIGGTLDDYANRPKLDSSQWWAQLWYANGSHQAEAILVPVPGSIVEFRTGPTAGLIKGIPKLAIPGTMPGDHVTLQLRVWNNAGGTLLSWDQALLYGSASGKSNLIVDFSLTPPNGTVGDPIIESEGLLASQLQYFGLTIPEPSSLFILCFGIGWILLFRLKIKTAEKKETPTHCSLLTRSRELA